MLVEDHSARKILSPRMRMEFVMRVYIVWDDQNAYYLLGGGIQTSLRVNTKLLSLGGNQSCWSINKSFDFEGSMIEPIERVFRSFGARTNSLF